MTELISGTDRSVEASAGDITPAQISRIIEYFGRHATSVFDVMVDYDQHTQHLILSGIPSPNVNSDEASAAFENAIKTARVLHPADDVDMSL